ncbi:putative hydrolase [Gordonia westfalica]|uniref:Putative hydrolase n=1 Tax=Gordonia westfalica TaxID=158898 RepID=A0A1H2IUD2_9ACTN|nr:putative hydrolase [Gordonia westfalica]
MKPLEPLTSPVDPVEALTRISWLLEQRRESTYRVEAFRRAAQAAARLSPDDLRTSRSLTTVKGIGKTTAAVIGQAVDGRVPEYLARLQDEDPPYPPEGADDLVTAVVGDLHAHTEWSDGGAPIDEMASAAQAMGHEWLAITDHSPRLTVANGLSADRLAAQIEVIDEWNSAQDNSFHLLRGIEIDILDDGALDQSDEMIDRLDIVTASVHSHLRMDHDAMTARLVNAVSDPRVHVLGHCTGRRVLSGRGHRPRRPSTPAPSSTHARRMTRSWRSIRVRSAWTRPTS